MKIIAFVVCFASFFIGQESHSSYRGVRSYLPSKVGCLNPLTDFYKMDCIQQKLSFEVLRRLRRSNKTPLKRELSHRVLSRARYFLKKKEVDYQSVISLMVFPIHKKEYWLKQFQKLAGADNPFPALALHRLQKKQKPDVCHDLRGISRFRFYEVCNLAVFTN